MKKILGGVCVLFLFCGVLLQAEHVVVGKLDPSKETLREAAFTPWNDPEQSGISWREHSGTHIPIYNQLKGNSVVRDIWVPNENRIPYWVVGALTEQSLIKTHKEKLKIGDELVSASCYTDERGNKTYWALWCPGNKSYWVKDKLRALGIEPPQIEYTFFEQLERFSTSLGAFTGLLSLLSLGVNVLIVALLVYVLKTRVTLEKK